MEYNEKDFPKRIYNVLWNGNLMMLLRLNPDKFKISNVDKMGMPYAYIRMLDCKRGEKWNLCDCPNEIDECLNDKYKSGYTLLSKEYIATKLNLGHEFGTIFTLDERKAIAISKANWEQKNPTGEAYDVVRYWDDCDRTILNKEPLTYQEANELYRQESRPARYGSLYSWAVEVHK